MRKIFKNTRASIFNIGLLALMVIFMASCSQSRNGIGKKKRSEIWGALQVCDIPDGWELMGCFSLEPNIGANSVEITVIDLGINPVKIPYRILARRPQDIAFTVLQDNVQADIGRTFTVKAGSKHFIEAYEEWRFEAVAAVTDDRYGLALAKAGTGAPLAQVKIFWPELNMPAPK